MARSSIKLKNALNNKTSKRLRFRHSQPSSGTQFIFQGRKRRGAGFLSKVIQSVRGAAKTLSRHALVKKGLAAAKKQLKKKSTQKRLARTAENLASSVIDRISPASSEEKRLLKGIQKKQIKKIVKKLASDPENYNIHQYDSV